MEKNRKDMRNVLIFATILLIILLAFFWIYPLISNETIPLEKQILYSVMIIIGLIGGGYSYFHQKELDKNPNINQNTFKEKAFRGVNKYHGIELGFGSIQWAIISAIFFFGGILWIIFSPEYWWLGGIFIILSFLLIIAVKGLWKLSKKKSSGRYY